jgi:arylsulfatase A
MKHYGFPVAAMALLMACCLLCGSAHAGANPARPNVVIIFLDDSGYADFSPFGTPGYPTPHYERLAQEGSRFTQFYVPQAICSASRAALLTGCYPERNGVTGAIPPGVRGLEPNFQTMGEVLKHAGYATAVFGKWHIGDEPDTRPHARGFDESCGLMYSNDMWNRHPERPENFPMPLHFYENGEVKIESVTEEHQRYLTRWYTEHAVDFITRHREDPFFLYLPHSMPHVPLFCSPEFEGRSGKGRYGDVMMELDWSLGKVMEALEETGTAENTLVIFTSDNGPWHVYGNHAGETPFREAKGTSFDGGIRSACVMRWPGRIPAGKVNGKTLSSIDLLPTIAEVCGAPLPDYPIDGKSQLAIITGERRAKNPQPYYAISIGEHLEAIVSSDGKWKLHVPHRYRFVETSGHDGMPGQYGYAEQELALYDLRRDPLESTNVLEKFPKVARRMQQWAEEHRAQFAKK